MSVQVPLWAFLRLPKGSLFYCLSFLQTDNRIFRALRISQLASDSVKRECMGRICGVERTKAFLMGFITPFSARSSLEFESQTSLETYAIERVVACNEWRRVVIHAHIVCHGIPAPQPKPGAGIEGHIEGGFRPKN